MANFRKRKAQRGANLVLIAVALTVLIGMTGVGIYTGLQAYLRNEIQKAAGIAAMAGASQYYLGGPGGAAQPGEARRVAQQVFDDVVSNTPALKAFKTRLTGIQTGNGRVSVSVEGTMDTPLLEPVNIQRISVNGESTAQYLIYPPTFQTGMVMLAPPQLEDEFLKLEFPLVDNPGTDIFVESPGGSQNGYLVKACNESVCYDLMSVATGDTAVRMGRKVCLSRCSFDIGAAGVKKASEIRFVDDRIWSHRVSSGNWQMDTVPPVVKVGHVYLYGYAGACVSQNRCSTPSGFITHP